MTALLDTAGNVIERYTYSPYGQPHSSRTRLPALDPDNQSDVANPVTYTGRQFDPRDGALLLPESVLPRVVGKVREQGIQLAMKAASGICMSTWDLECP